MNDELVPESPLTENTAELQAEAPGEEAPENRPVSRLVFPVSGQGLLYDQRLAMEYLEGQAIYRIPNAHPLFRGLVNRRGSLVPVFDIRRLVDPQANTKRESRLLVLGRGDDAVGIVLDDTPYRVSLPEDRKSQPPGYLGDVFGNHLGDCFEHEGRYLLGVALDDFLYDLAREAA